MKLQPASQREVKRMAVGVCALSAVEFAVFIVLHLLGVFPFSSKIVFGIIGGTVVAVLNFILLCLTVQKAVGMESQKAMKAHIQFSYNFRLITQAGWVVVAFLVPRFNVVAAALPLLFPTLIIFMLQKKGTLVEPSERKNPEPSEDDEEDEERLESFEA